MNIKIDVSLEVPIKRVLAHLNNWIELSEDSWVQKIKPILNEVYKLEDFRPGGRMNPHDNFNCAPAVVATTPGCYLLVTCDENDDGSETKDYIFDMNAIQRGLQVMADKYPKHFFDFYEECGGDIVTSSVFVQCCLFGEVVFG